MHAKTKLERLVRSLRFREYSVAEILDKAVLSREWRYATALAAKPAEISTALKGCRRRNWLIAPRSTRTYISSLERCVYGASIDVVDKLARCWTLEAA